MWELLHMTQAYQGVKPLEIRDSIRGGERLPIDSEISDELKSLVLQAWDQNPRARPTFSGIVTFLRAFQTFNPKNGVGSL
jgi:hypothetical protein